VNSAEDVSPSPFLSSIPRFQPLYWCHGNREIEEGVASMKTLAVLSTTVRRARRRRSLDLTLASLHPAVRDEVLNRWESEAG
jgi:hypothetical protein